MFAVLQILFPYLLILYLLDCVTYVSIQHITYSSYLGKRFTAIRPGLHLIGLLPISRTFVSHNIPLFLTSIGIYLPRASESKKISCYRTNDFEFLSYEKIVDLNVNGRSIEINGKMKIMFPSSLSAMQMTNQILSVKRVEPTKRVEILKDYLQSTTDYKKISTVGMKNRILSHIEILSLALFISVFFLLPLVLYSKINFLYYFFQGIVLASIILYLSIVSMTIIVKKTRIIGSFPGKVFANLILSPVSAIHIMKEIYRDIYVSFDHLTIAALLLPTTEFNQMMREELIQLEYAIDEVSWPDLKDFFKDRLDGLTLLLDAKGVSKSALFETPEKNDPSAIMYCPLCLTEYRVEKDKCVDCDVFLRLFHPVHDENP